MLVFNSKESNNAVVVTNPTEEYYLIHKLDVALRSLVKEALVKLDNLPAADITKCDYKTTTTLVECSSIVLTNQITVKLSPTVFHLPASDNEKKMLQIIQKHKETLEALLHLSAEDLIETLAPLCKVTAASTIDTTKPMSFQKHYQMIHKDFIIYSTHDITAYKAYKDEFLRDIQVSLSRMRYPLHVISQCTSYKEAKAKLAEILADKTLSDSFIIKSECLSHLLNFGEDCDVKEFRLLVQVLLASTNLCINKREEILNEFGIQEVEVLLAD